MTRVVALGKAGRQDAIGLAVVVAATAGVIAYRYAYIEPRAWGAICAAASPPLACAPRAALLWLQQKYLWGSISLALGLVAFLCRGPFWLAVAAIIVGVAAVENYNATWGMLGLALGAWVWVGKWDERRRIAAAGTLLLLCLLPAAASIGQPRGNAAAALDAFKHLQGTWSITSGDKPIATQMTYDIGSRGSIVTEQFGKELSVFTRDGGRLLMTHYCNAGNQPRLALKAGTPPGVFDFTMVDITGLDDPKSRHVQEIVYQIAGPDTLKLSLIWTGEGTGAPENYTLTRMPGKR